MPFDPWPVAAAGLVAGLLMLAVRSVLTALGVDLRMDLLLMWGTLFGLRGAAGRIAGLAMHAAMSVAIGAVYALGFHLLGVMDNLWLWGLLGGVVHWVLAGLFLTAVPAMHPEIPARRAAPGTFSRNFGRGDVAAFLAGHLAYGLAFAVVYAILHRAGGAAAAF